MQHDNYFWLFFNGLTSPLVPSSPATVRKTDRQHSNGEKKDARRLGHRGSHNRGSDNVPDYACPVTALENSAGLAIYLKGHGGIGLEPAIIPRDRHHVNSPIY